MSLPAVQAAVGLVGDGHRTEPGAALKHQLAGRFGKGMELFFNDADRLRLAGGGLHRPAPNQKRKRKPATALCRPGQGLVDIGDDVVDMLDAD